MVTDKKCLLFERTNKAFKFDVVYQIIDPSNGTQIGVAKEENKTYIFWMRLMLSKARFPNNIVVYDEEGKPELSIKKPFSFFKSKILVFDKEKNYMGCIKRKLFKLFAYDIFDSYNKKIAQVNGKYRFSSYKILGNDNMEMCTMTQKKYSASKALLTMTNNFIFDINEQINIPESWIKLFMGSCLAINIECRENA